MRSSPTTPTPYRESQIRIAAAAAGLDPTVGYPHAGHPDRVALAHDLTEPPRPRADRLVLDFVRRHTFAPGDVILTERGVCRLHPQLARSVAGLTLGGAAVEDVVATLVRELVGAPRARRGDLTG